jgi:hypothetical protein
MISYYLIVSAGPVGLGGEVSGSVAERAALWSYSKSKGLFAGEFQTALQAIVTSCDLIFLILASRFQEYLLRERV